MQKVNRKRGRPPKCALGATESQNDKEEDQKRLKRTRLQQIASISSSTSSLDPFAALNEMPGITPESPKKDHYALKPGGPSKGKKVVRTILPSPDAPSNIKMKVHHQEPKSSHKGKEVTRKILASSAAPPNPKRNVCHKESLFNPY